MRKSFFAVIAIVAGFVLAFSLVTKQTHASRAIFVSGSQDEIETAKRLSYDVLRESAAQRPIGNASDFTVKRAEIDESRVAHTHFQQTVDGIPVWGGEAIVHLNADGKLVTVTDDLRESIAVNTTPNLSAEDAVKAAMAMYRGSANLTAKPTADLWVYRGTDRDHLAYRVSMRREDGTKNTAMPVIFVDAQTGEKVFQYDNLQTGSGPSLYSGTVNIGTSVSGSYYMENTTRKVGTFDARNGTTSIYRFTDTNDIWDATSQRAGVDASYGAEATMNYFQNVHGRNGIDGSGGPAYYTSAVGGVGLISSVVHYSSNYNNAFWNGQYMTYGDGDGTTFSPLVTLDICGHEMTHGVTERTANLTYSGESGALNESMSDVFGVMVERYVRPTTWNWKIGEDAYTPSNGTSDALRFMDNPHNDPNSGFTADDDPDHYSERYTGTADNGGVHVNSGIANNVFYRVSQGGSNHLTPGVTVSGIGPDKAAAIWYKALTTYMTASTNFAGARTATLNAATQLYGSTSSEYIAVQTGWCTAGIGTCPSTGTPTPTPGGTELLTNGGFETSVNPWVSSGTGALYTANGNYPHGGTGYVYYGAANSVTGQTYQDVTIPAAAAANLSLWLNVTSAETTTTTQYDKLFVEVRNTAGTLLATPATFSNLNKVATAGQYTQYSFSLAAYRGQTVRIQLRTTTDSSAITTFRVDDVSLR